MIPSQQQCGELSLRTSKVGSHGVDVITSDHHGGLVKAIRQHFQGVTWKRCQTQFMRNRCCS
ncbi:hypothetical protein DOE73_24980 [Paenibacillus dendritiformis]|nr:hypothetical protein DOE73_24980 [Paenibacillus dendritiformis]